MKYAHLEEKTNKILGWYDDSIHSEAPTPNVNADDDVWQEALNVNANCYENGNFIVKDFRTEEDLLQEKINEAKTYLQATDFKMTVDYFGTLTKEEQDELIAKRAEAREIIRGGN